MIPQIIYMSMLLLGVGISLEQHGKTKEVRQSCVPTIIAAVLQITILYLGGFFNCFLK